MTDPSATSVLATELKTKLQADLVYSNFGIYAMADLDEAQYPKMPFIALQVKKRDTGGFLESTIRGATIDILIAFLGSDTHPSDPSLKGWNYAEWLAENTAKFMNNIDFANLLVFENDCSEDTTDTMINDDLVYMVMVRCDLLYETQVL
jgi:hypothetical protein